MFEGFPASLHAQSLEFAPLQEDVPVVSRPFQEIGRRVGMTEDEVLRKIAEWKEDGTLRRFVSVVQHRRLGFRANAMGAWCVPPDRVEECVFAHIRDRDRSTLDGYRRTNGYVAL